MKIWLDGTSEPANWDVSGPQTAGSPATGSLLIVAHELDVSVGNVTVTPLQAPSTLVSDDFYADSLNRALWTFVNPRNDAASATITGAGTTNARLAIGVPGGVKHEPWLPVNTAPRVLQAVNNTSFEAELRFESSFSSEVQMHGFLAEQDSVNFVRFDFSSSGTATKIFAGTVKGTTGTGRYNVNITTGLPQYMKVKRLGDLWTLWYSYDRTVWTQAVQFVDALNLKRVGPFAGNAGTTNPAYAALVDYVFNTTSPLVPEDGGAGVPAVVVVEPPDFNSTEGDSATVSVQATGTPTLTYRWQRNGIDIGGATGASYRFGPVSVAADNGAQFRCIVSNAFGADTSRSATLTVAYPPSIIVSDDFRAPALSTSLWRVVNPLNDATIGVTGTGTENARLSISVPAGVSHDAWTSGNTTPRILQDCEQHRLRSRGAIRIRNLFGLPDPGHYRPAECDEFRPVRFRHPRDTQLHRVSLRRRLSTGYRPHATQRQYRGKRHSTPSSPCEPSGEPLDCLLLPERHELHDRGEFHTHIWSSTRSVCLPVTPARHPPRSRCWSTISSTQRRPSCLTIRSRRRSCQTRPTAR